MDFVIATTTTAVAAETTVTTALLLSLWLLLTVVISHAYKQVTCFYQLAFFYLSVNLILVRKLRLWERITFNVIEAFDVFIVCFACMWYFRHLLLILHLLWNHCDRFNQKRICHIEWQPYTINLQDYHLCAEICMYTSVRVCELICLFVIFSVLFFGKCNTMRVNL